MPAKQLAMLTLFLEFTAHTREYLLHPDTRELPGQWDYPEITDREADIALTLAGAEMRPELN